MFFEPIEIELDKPRKFKLTPKALRRAEDTINRSRGAKAHERASIDYLIFKARKDSVLGQGSLPRDLFVVLLWSGLFDLWPKQSEEDPGLTMDKVEELVYETSPLTAGAILDLVMEHYSEVTNKKKADKETGRKGDQENGADESPLAPRPGSTSGALQ